MEDYVVLPVIFYVLFALCVWAKLHGGSCEMKMKSSRRTIVYFSLFSLVWPISILAMFVAVLIEAGTPERKKR